MMDVNVTGSSATLPVQEQAPVNEVSVSNIPAEQDVNVTNDPLLVQEQSPVNDVSVSNLPVEQNVNVTNDPLSVEDVSGSGGGV